MKITKLFEAVIAAGFDAETAVQPELVLRQVSLVWRLRRATAIDAGLLETPMASPIIIKHALSAIWTAIERSHPCTLEGRCCFVVIAENFFRSKRVKQWQRG